ncbi:hypothetical protein [Bordetella petrii]|uniref:hypothetical protein n=1 Tax=Bordetella petrii TaxID=94624 RepID=UPI001A963D7F|nr:hypothetical protein [Bordetella petrii]MBO1113984.1 hypothetical protein [Bordetella petrii]
MFGFLRNTQQVDEEVQDEFIERVNSAAEAFLAAVPDTPALDYSIESVTALDAVLEEAYQGRLTLTPMQTVGAAAYLYEVGRRHYGGLYEVCDDEDPVVLVTGEPDFDVCLCAISKVERRVRNGAADTLPEFFQHYVRAVTARSSDTIR